MRTHHDHLRALLPILDLETAPAAKDMAGLNAALLSGQRKAAGTARS